MGVEKRGEDDPIPVTDPTDDLSNSSEDRQKEYEAELDEEADDEEEWGEEEDEEEGGDDDTE